MSFGFVRLRRRNGSGWLSGHRHRLHLHSLIALPVLLCSMVLVAAAFAVNINRRSDAFCADWRARHQFSLYFGRRRVCIGLIDECSNAASCLTPAGVTMMIGLALLLHLETADGAPRRHRAIRRHGFASGAAARDQLTSELPLLMLADEINYDEELKTVVAKGFEIVERTNASGGHG